MTINIETYLNSLSEDILDLNISCLRIKSLPNLTRFKNLKTLDCSNNKLNLLPTLPQNLKTLYCSNNKLTLLPTLPQNLKTLNCHNNKLTLLPTLPQNLKTLYCHNNKLTLLPTLLENLEILGYSNNPIYKIVNNDTLLQIKQNIQILNNFRYLYYSLKFKKQFRKWLWEKIREVKIKKMYHPNYLVENLKEEDELDIVLNNWK
jgi:Leucine-rich repeat (LRR) protein